MADRAFAIAGKWALATDGHQWILQRHQGGQWRAISFVHSTRDILARCMREKGVEAAYRVQLLAWLPETFDQWEMNLRVTPDAILPTLEDSSYG